jgi:hypothetical protein
MIRACLGRLRRAALLATAAVTMVPAASADASFSTGFTDDEVLLSPSPAVRAAWLDRVAGEHGGIIRLDLLWNKVAGSAPTSGYEASDPSWPGYDWSVLDAAVRDATARGLQVVITVIRAPSWAEGPGRPASAPPGAWMPRPGALGALAHAAALRYSGGYTPPGFSAPLPRVRYWQAWNEPNLALYLMPQWRRVRGGYVPASPAVYRGMLNAFYAAVHAVQPDARVLSAGTSPYGDQPGSQRMPPALFLRELLCLRGSSLVPERCPHPARFDILDHHPYSVEGPGFHAFNADDVAIVDLAKLTTPLRRAEHLRLVGGSANHEFWVTETSWDSNPPDPHGVPVATQARWLEQTFYLLWRQGVSTVLWFLIKDAPPIPDYASTYQSGTYLIDGQAKPSATAFRFPFVVARAGRGALVVWGKAPSAGLVRIERNTGSAWALVQTVPTTSSGIFQSASSVRRGELLRARVGSETSLTWRAPA